MIDRPDAGLTAHAQIGAPEATHRFGVGAAVAEPLDCLGALPSGDRVKPIADDHADPGDETGRREQLLDNLTTAFPDLDLLLLGPASITVRLNAPGAFVFPLAA